MKIKNCLIRNFRGLKDIDLSFDNNTCLIAGPNAIGKSTVLEAIRLNRALLLSRYPSEGQAVLHALGAAANPNQVMFRGGYFEFSAIARDPLSNIQIRMEVQLDGHELAKVNGSLHSLALDHLRGSMGNQLQQDQSALTQFLSSDAGRGKFAESEAEISSYISTLNTSDTLPLGLEITPDGQIRGEHASAQIVCGFLERSLPPQQALFSIFSADRALPAGEAAIQLGAGDSDSQIKSHIAEPQVKFHRLKTSIANSTLLHENIDEDFKIIFDEILPGKQLNGVEIGAIGNFRVSILEHGVDRPFDIDSLSSGEKGLILTFMLIRRAVAEGGIVLIDEPELHLNPGVCRKLLHFLIDHCIEPHKLQAIICTHSAEILNSAYERDDCDIHHLKDSENATPIYRGDFDEMFRALGRLGVSPAESFFYESRLFVEGPHDEELLEEGFRTTLGDRCQISSLGGRKAVEAEIRNLQAAEAEGRLDRLHCFIFDQDRDVTNLDSTPLVKVLQWDRYCFENYLLNVQALYDVLRPSATGTSFPDRGMFLQKVKELAFEQIKPLAARQAYEPDRLRGPGLTNEDIGGSFEDMRDILFGKLQSLKDSLSDLDLDTWRNSFLTSCESINAELVAAWDVNWAAKCNGKELIEKICREYSINRDRREIKKELVRLIRDQNSPEWRTVEGLLRESVNNQ
ncbi:ATP-dependent nuclease [Mariprofundus micogutta]|uniref:ATP-dependent nuclease n=1 Tax=Mariprofundus micogutta TaxID=1921010 RepID=UPI000932D814|nr:AAA family ATPase [Mariprofundus micogutta]